MNRKSFCFWVHIAPVLVLSLSLPAKVTATVPPTDGIVEYHWTGTVGNVGSFGGVYGISLGDPASLKVTVEDDIAPYQITNSGSKYRMAWIEIQAGPMTAFPDGGQGVVYGWFRISDDILFNGDWYDRIQMYADFDSATWGYIECLGSMYFDPSAFDSEDLPLSTPDAPMIPLYPQPVEISNAYGLLAGIDFDSFTVMHIPEPADVNTDTVVDVQDLLAVIGAFGSPCKMCDEDVNGDGVVDITDLLMVISAWDQ